MTNRRRSRPAKIISTVLVVLCGITVTLIGCRNDVKEIVVVESRPVRGQTAKSCLLTQPPPALEWDSELEFGCTGGRPCPPLPVARPGQCPDKDFRKEAADFEHLMAVEAAREPSCNGIVVVRSAALGSGSSYPSLQRSHWVLKIAHAPSEESQAWLLVRHDASTIGGYGQETAPEIVHKVCPLVRQAAQAEH